MRDTGLENFMPATVEVYM